MNLVWLKRDLRVRDHAPLSRALDCGPTFALFIIEPEWLAADEFSWNHFRFVLESLEELSPKLREIGVPLLIRTGSAVQVLAAVYNEGRFTQIFSHEETGLTWTYQRDLQVAEWCSSKSVKWNEFRQFGVIRRLKDRDTWAKKRNLILERPLHGLKAQPWPMQTLTSEPLPWSRLEHQSLMPRAQKGGIAQAEQCLTSFFDSRGENYFRSISSPSKAFDSCSRLSPYLAWGQISITEVHHAIANKRRSIANAPANERRLWQLSLKNFESRLWWHCHFIQKLESEPEIEFQNFNREFDGLRESEWNEAKFQAWCKGETGFPMIDACMRALRQNGWINFRMRAMLLSFATYQLWLHWKKPAIFLAQQFLDFEPGIHYSQVQMQAGVTGINTVRIYSPKKQQLDQDPNGEFVRCYVPELRNVTDADLAEPHLMPPLLSMASGFRLGVDYPYPIVNAEAAYQQAKDRIFECRNLAATRRAAAQVYQKHGSRKTK